MEVITAHTNADFDTFASMIAAKKLYPRARLVFSGSLEKGLRDALERIKLPFEIDKIKDIDLGRIKTLVLVDVRQPGRIGPFAEVAGKKGVEVHIYDHHPPTKEDIKGDVEHTAPYGSTTTVLTHLLREKRIDISPQEATVMMAGIYEDTGSLLFPSTTVKDFEAASYLLSKGADLVVVADLLRKELTPEEVAILNEFLHSETSYTIDGAEIVIAEGYLERYTGDISILAHKIRDIQRMSCLFLLVDTEDRVHLIARSSTPKVDVGKISRSLGGGGHAQAASATLKGATLIEAKERLLKAIRDNLQPQKSAEDIMSFPPITVGPDVTLKSAVELMRRYNINAAPVIKNGGALGGIITRQVLDRAVYHGLGDGLVKDYMTIDYETVSYNTSIDEIREKVIGHGTRILPVMKDKKVTGVITRTDLLKLLQEELREAAGKERKVRSLSKLMDERLPGWLMALLKEAGEVAEGLGMRAYAVGGFVRDLLLRRENLDVDLVVEGGDGIVFANEFAKRRNARVRPHLRFKTAVIIFPEGHKMDVATARLEFYERPGALPTVEESSLKLDLYRRDFIINTLAVGLNPKKFGELIDFFGAQKDIKERAIRVIHNLSFIEDPTRMLRAVRFSEKFDFKISKHTLNLIKNSVRLDILTRISGARLFDELKHILEEETAVKSIKRLNELGLLSLIDKKITWDSKRELFFERAKEAVIWHELLYTKDKIEPWLVLFLALTDELKEADFAALVKRLMIVGKKRLEVLGARQEGFRALGRISSGAAVKDSEIYGLLKPIPLEVIIYLIAKTQNEGSKKALSLYVTRLKYATTELGGNDLKKMGVSTGPEIGEILRQLLKKRLDNEITTREEEEEFVKNRFKGKVKKSLKAR